RHGAAERQVVVANDIEIDDEARTFRTSGLEEGANTVGHHGAGPFQQLKASRLFPFAAGTALWRRGRRFRRKPDMQLLAEPVNSPWIGRETSPPHFRQRRSSLSSVPGLWRA